MEYQIKNRVTSPKLSSVRLGGMSKTVSDRFFDARVFSGFAQNIVYKEAEDAFKNQVDDAQYFGYWQGEFWGKWVLSAVEVCRYSGSEQLKEFLHRGALKLLTYAREDGYLNTYKDSMNIFPVDPDVCKEKTGMRVAWNWNIWCRKYTLWGLIAVYGLTRDRAILKGAEGLATQLITELKKNHVELRKTGTFKGLPSGSIMKPMLELYGYTGKRKYLDFCIHEIADNWERADGDCPNLIVNGISKKPLTEWYPDSPNWAKAYEMMSCYEGLCELYRYTSEEKYLKAAEGVYESLVKNELNPAFSVAYNDVFADAAGEINLISEPCDAIHFMRLCYELFTLTGDAKYMDSFELTYFNAFLGGVFRDGRWGSRGIRGCGRQMWSGVQAGLSHQHCCVNNMPRAFMRMAEAAVMQTEDAILVNLYEPIRSKLAGATVTVGEGYFERGQVTVKVRFGGSTKPIRVRIPAWCHGADLTADGKTIRATSGYAEIKPTAATCEIAIDFHTTAEIHPFTKELHLYDELMPNGKPHWKLARWMNKGVGDTPESLFVRKPMCTVTYGPLLLAKSKMIGDTEEEIFGGQQIDGSWKVALNEVPDGDVRTAYLATFEKGSQSFTVKVCDYASGSDVMTDDDHFFSIYF